MQLPEGGETEGNTDGRRAQKEAPQCPHLESILSTRLDGQAAEEEASSVLTSADIRAEVTQDGTLACAGWKTHTCSPGQDTLISRTGAASPLQALPFLKGYRGSRGCQESNKAQQEAALRPRRGNTAFNLNQAGQAVTKDC